MSNPYNALAALVCLIQARGEGRPHAWQTLRTRNLELARHLETLGQAGWPALGQAVNDLCKEAVLKIEALVREEMARHGRDAREAWETVRGAGGADNGADLAYLWQVCPTAAGRLRNAMEDAEARKAKAWFSWTKRKARAAAWAWTDGYLDRGYQPKGSLLPSWLDDLDTDARARIEINNPKVAYAATWKGATAAWAREWMVRNRPPAGESDTIRLETILVIQAALKKREEALYHIGEDEEEFSDLFDDEE